MRIVIVIWIALMTYPALAEPIQTAQDLYRGGLNWKAARQYSKAIDEFAQAYRQRPEPVYLYRMAQSYEGMAALPTKTVVEVLESKQQALGLYETAIATAAPTETWINEANGHIEQLRQEINKLAIELAAEREQREQQRLRIKAIEERLQVMESRIEVLIDLFRQRRSASLR